MGYETVSSPRRLFTIASAVAAVLASAAPAANAGGIELGEGLSVTGFVDMSYTSTDFDGAEGGSTNSFGIDQVEMDFMYAGSNGVSAQVDIEFGESASDLDGSDDTFVEQAFVTKTFSDEFSVKVGRFLSYSGWETEEPTGLMQYSGVGYAKNFYGYYQQGVSAMYKAEKFALMGSVVTDVFALSNGAIERDTDDLGYELGVAVMPFEGLTSKLFYMSDKKSDVDVFNFWTSYSISGFTFAGEYNDADYGTANKGDGFLLMGNYTSGPWGVTVRYHDWDLKSSGTSYEKVTGFTLSPSYKVGDNLLLVAEYRSDNVKAGSPFGPPSGEDRDVIALEALFTF